MKSISEFIQEQETGIQGVEVTMEQVYVETMNACAVAACYVEQADLIRFAAENGIDTLTVVQEDGTEKKESKGNIFKRAGHALKNAGTWIVDMIKALIKKIKGFFTQAKFKSMSEKVSKYDPETKIQLDPSIFAPLAILEVLGNLESFFIDLKGGNNSQLSMKVTAIENFTKAFTGKKNPAEGFLEIKNNATSDAIFKGEYIDLIQSAGKEDKIDTTYGEYQKLLVDLSKKNPAAALSDKADKALKAFEDVYNPDTYKSYKDDELPADMDAPEDHGYKRITPGSSAEGDWYTGEKADPAKAKSIAIMKEFINVMNKCYDAGIKAADKTVYPDKETEAKNKVEGKQESFYFV